MAIAKQVVSPVGIETRYHRIQSITFDYQYDQVHVEVLGYAGEEYRQMEKDEIAECDASLEALRALEEKESLTEEEAARVLELRNQERELTAHKFTPRHMTDTKYTLPITDDIRGAVYRILTDKIPTLAGGIEI